MSLPPSPFEPDVLLESFSPGSFSPSYRFGSLKHVLFATRDEEVVHVLKRVEQEVSHGHHAVGFVSYEAATALNPHLTVSEPSGLPLVWFGIYAERHNITPDSLPEHDTGQRVTTPELQIDRSSYTADVAAIRSAIAAGETYQINYTTRQRFSVNGERFSLYRALCRNQPAPFCAWLDIGSHTIISASPELFFSLKGQEITMKPMKGTAPRRPDAAGDRRQRQALAESPKERSENLMIVDLVRNDLGRIAETGSVATPALFQVETYPTVHQMTSTVTARLKPEVGLTDIFRALFPCGSVTGAPKKRSMEIIAGLEKSPRGVYCGAIGYLSPGNEAVFSVAIRTIVIDNATGRGEIGIGSGITWDSDAAGEFSECLAKGAFLTCTRQPFQLIETLRHDRGGYLLLDRHLRRFGDSADYFAFRYDTDELRRRLNELGQRLAGTHKVRVLLSADGGMEITTEPLEAPFLSDPGSADTAPLSVVLARQRVKSNDPFRYHKTTCRSLLDEERRAHPGCYDVLFLNEQSHLTEGSFNSLVISLEGELLTPPLGCGLLPGVLRDELLESGMIREEALTVDDLKRAERFWLINSVRGWRECRLETSATEVTEPTENLKEEP